MRIKFIIESFEKKDLTIEGIEIEHTFELEELKAIEKADLTEIKNLIKEKIRGGRA